MKIEKNPDYFMKIAILTASNSTCTKKAVGAVLVKNGRIVSTGYNGAPSGINHCTTSTCLRTQARENQNPDLCRGLHAEENCIIQCAIHGTPIGENSIIYCTHFPCMNCAKIIINSKIKTIVFMEEYEMENTLKMQMLKDSEIEIYKYFGANMIKKYKFKI